jgi:5'-nucleotidase
MRILVSNDDGFFAHGLPPLVEALGEIGEVWVVAPHRERSAQSHAFTMFEPLRLMQRRPRMFACTGTPADCVYLGVHHVMPGPPDLVVSGINRGANLSNDVLYSGTCAAAMEAALVGLPALAVSLYVDWEKPAEEHNYTAAARVATDVAAKLLVHGMPYRTMLNLNVPDGNECKGVVPCALGERRYEVRVDQRTDPRGKPYYWLGGKHRAFVGDNTDGHLVTEGWATLTPMKADMTDRDALAKLGDWGLSSGPKAP